MADHRHHCAEIEYQVPGGLVHSDICGHDISNAEWHKVLHEALDEWLEKSNGTGIFYVGDASRIR